MDSKDNNDDFLGESIDEIFNSQFVKSDSKKKDDGKVETSIIDDDSVGGVDENVIEDEDDIYVLEDPGIEVVTIKRPAEETEKRNNSEADGEVLSSFDIEEDFELLEKEFDSVGNEKNTTGIIDNKSAELEFEGHNDLMDDDPLDLEDEFVNMRPPEESKKEEEDLDEFVLESHQYSVDDETPPPIPSISKDGDEFLLDSELAKENSMVLDNSDYSSSEIEGSIKDSFTLENVAEDNEQEKTEGRFFDANGRPVNDADILKPETPNLRKKKTDSSDAPSKSLQRALDKTENNYISPLNVMKQSNPLFEKKNLIIGGSVIIILIAAIIFFILPTFFGNSTPVQKNKLIVSSEKNNLLAKKKSSKKEKEEGNRSGKNK